MKRFAVMGLGSFGSNLARSLTSKGAEVLAIDIDEHAVDDIKEDVTQAVVADASDKKAMLSLDIESFDCVIVSLGERVDATILVALFLRKVGVRKIVVKAISEDHAEALRSVGATNVVIPEKDMALKIADSLITPNLIDFIPVSEGLSIVEMKPPSECVEKTLAELKLRNRFNLQVLAVKTDKASGDTASVNSGADSIVIPDASFRIGKRHVLIIMGANEDIEKFRELD